MSAITRCPLYSISAIDRFDCKNTDFDKNRGCCKKRQRLPESAIDRFDCKNTDLTKIGDVAKKDKDWLKDWQRLMSNPQHHHPPPPPPPPPPFPPQTIETC